MDADVGASAGTDVASASNLPQAIERLVCAGWTDPFLSTSLSPKPDPVAYQKARPLDRLVSVNYLVDPFDYVFALWNR